MQIRLLKQGRKGRGGARKDVYSAETEEWERKVRLEKLEQAKREQTQKIGPPPFDLAAFKEEEEMRNRLRVVAQNYATAARIMAVICENSHSTGANLRLIFSKIS